MPISVTAKKKLIQEFGSLESALEKDEAFKVTVTPDQLLKGMFRVHTLSGRRKNLLLLLPTIFSQKREERSQKVIQRKKTKPTGSDQSQTRTEELVHSRNRTPSCSKGPEALKILWPRSQ